MAKRSLSLVAILLFMALPYTAHGAWTLNTWAKSAGGTIVVRGGTPQTSANGSVFKTYTTSKPFAVTINANTGYAISAVTYNSVAQTLPIASPKSYTVQARLEKVAVCDRRRLDVAR